MILFILFVEYKIWNQIKSPIKKDKFFHESLWIYTIIPIKKTLIYEKLASTLRKFSEGIFSEFWYISKWFLWPLKPIFRHINQFSKWITFEDMHICIFLWNFGGHLGKWPLTMTTGNTQTANMFFIVSWGHLKISR